MQPATTVSVMEKGGYRHSRNAVPEMTQDLPKIDNRAHTAVTMNTGRNQCDSFREQTWTMEIIGSLLGNSNRLD